MRLDSVVEETIGKGGGHIEDGRPIFFAVSCRPDEPVFGNFVAPDLAIEDELLGDALHGRRSHIEFIKE